ncbi:MAG: hypothetical protein ACOVP4_03625 [Bacteriovoracaceae bacterium]
MKKLISFLTVATLFTTSIAHASSCHSSAGKKDLKKIKGVYQGCAPSIHGNGYYDYYKVSITEKGDYTSYLQLHGTSDCSDAPINKISYQYQVSKIKKVSKIHGQTTFDVDLKVKRTDVQMVHPGYYPYLNNITECGFTDWSPTAWKNITAKTCPFLLAGDAFHDTYRAQGAIQYITIKYTKSGPEKLLDIPVPFRTTGDSPSQRENVDFLTTSNSSLYLN